MEIKKRLDFWDNMEFLQVNSSKHEFPMHYHDTYCISIVEEGFFGENNVIAPAGSLIISHPFEVHQNNLVGNSTYSLTSFYINPSLWKYLSNDAVSFENKVICDYKLYSLFKAIVAKINTSSTQVIQQNLQHSIFKLATTHGSYKPFHSLEKSNDIDEIKQFIDQEISNKLSLDTLSKTIGMTKFQFTRWFKKQVGISPFEYILLQKTEKAKKLILNDVSLVHIALDLGFYDQSHFSNYFKKYVGVSPMTYKNHCNIFQEK